MKPFLASLLTVLMMFGHFTSNGHHILTPEIIIDDFRVECRDAGTADNAADDKLVIWITARLINSQLPSNYFIITFNSEIFQQLGEYNEENYFELPNGSAASAGHLVLTISNRDFFVPEKMLVYKMQGTCSSVPLPCPLSAYFHQQSDIDSFSIRYPGCQVLNNLLLKELDTIAGTPTIQNLEGLRQIKELKGYLGLIRSHVQNVAGLDSLKSAFRVTIVFKENPHLTSIAELNNLQHIYGLNLFDDFNGNLKSLKGLENLSHIFIINCLNMFGLKNFEGLNNLKSGGLFINNCRALENLKGLDKLEESITMGIWENPKLKSLSGLENLKSISGDPNISRLALANNKILDDISALDHPINIKDLRIHDHPKLSHCAVESICTLLKSANTLLLVENNGLNCNSVQVIQNKCKVSAEEISQESKLHLFPIPASKDKPLRLALENDIIGELKIELLSLEGRLLQQLFIEKTTSLQVYDIDQLPFENSFFIRVTDGRKVFMRHVFKS